MKSFYKTGRYGKIDKEVQLRQGAADNNDNNVVHSSQSYDKVIERATSKLIKRYRKKQRYLKGYPYLPTIGEDDDMVDYDHVRNLDESFDFSPHAGLETFSDKLDFPFEFEFFEKFKNCLKDLSKYAKIDVPDDMLVEIEGLAALIFTIQGCADLVSTTSAIFLYARKFLDTSATSMIMKYIHQLLHIETQAGEECVLERRNWVELMKCTRDNWKMAKENQLFGHFSKLLGLVVTLGMCKASSLTLTIKDLKIFEPDMKLIHGSAIDIIDATLQSVVFFVERISMCITDKSLRPLIIDDKAAVQLDEDFADLVLWWGLVKNGNLEKVAGVPEHMFDKKLEELTTKIKQLMAIKSSFEKKLLSDKFMRLLQIKNDYITMKISCGVREAPFCIELFGESSQGKSTCADEIIDALLTSAGLSTDKQYRAVHNAGDRFMSTWSTDKTVLMLDDHANDKSTFVEMSPTRILINVANNIPFCANMADLDSKGKVFVEPKLVMLSTNVKNLDAHMYSNCPYSIQRRMHVVITVKAKPMFQYIVDGRPQGIDSKKVHAHYEQCGGTPLFDDLWDLSVEKAVQPEELKAVGTYTPIEFKGQPLINVSFRTVLQFLIHEFTLHRKSQASIITRMRQRAGGIELCGYEGCNQIKNYCDLHDGYWCREAGPADKPIVLPDKKEETPMQPEWGEESKSAMKSAKSMVMRRLSRDVFGLDHMVDGACTIVLMTVAKKFVRHWDWLSLVPTPWIHNEYFRSAMMLLHKEKLKRRYVTYTIFLWSTLLWFVWKSLPYFDGYFRKVFIFYILWIGIGCQKLMADTIKEYFYSELVKRSTIHESFRRVRDAHVENICKVAGIIGTLYAISRFYKSWKAMHQQGSLEPVTEQDVIERDSEKNVWTSVVTRQLPMQEEAKNTSSDQLRGLVSKNLVYGTVVADDKVYMVNGLFVQSNIVMIPDHYFTTDVLDVTFRKCNPDSAGGKFPVRISKYHSVRIPDTDLRVCYSSSGGSFKNLSKYLPSDTVALHEFDMLWRTKSGEMIIAQGLAEPARTSNGACEFNGHKYVSLTMDTFRGLCGATLISRRKPLITGFHLGGRTGTPRGCSGQLLLSQYEAALSELRKKEGVIVSGSAEKFEKQVLGVNVIKDQPLHPKSPLNFMPENSQVEYYGGCLGMTTFASNVKPTLISELVTEVLGEPNIYGPPVENPQYFGWQECLSNLAVPALPYDPELLAIAVMDYKDTMIDLYGSELWRCKPLTDQENLCGIPGKKFMDAIKLDTAVGYPLTGTKRRFVNELPPTPDCPNNRELDPLVMEEINRCEECYRRGERAYTIAKACKKDEVLSKRKCRIFYGNSIALTWLIRKYFLPILRVMQMHPLRSECAVGINSHGPEWDELHKHVFTFGENRLIGGDYGKYDQKLPAQLIFAALRILIDFARAAGYDDESLQIMEAMTGDIVFAVIAFNGDLIGLTEGTHISGNSLTVIINGICGSLNLRAYFYHENPCESFETRMKFRDHVKLSTYGDDNIGSVSEKINNFTIKGISEFLAKYGQKYTMPDKESELLDYLPKEDFEFLKRSSVYHESLGVRVGALADKSCIKMLHCYMRGKNPPLTEEHACGQNIDTALREWFNHGEEIYEKRRIQMQEIAKRASIEHLCTELDVPYQERVERWHAKYTKGYELYNDPDDFEY